MINSRIHNSRPNVTIRSGTPHNRVSSFQTGQISAGSAISAGTPIGLLLALTYAADFVSGQTFYGDSRPNARISD